MTILIKNTQLLDGTGKPVIKADILIKNDKISAIDNFLNYKADEIIDVMGSYLAPGFIDINNKGDRSLEIFSNDYQENILKQGITSIIGGHGGFSLAPLLYGSLEAIKPWADIRKINVNWHTLAEFLKTFKIRKLGVNFGTFLGHTTVRFDIVHDAHKLIFRDLTLNESAVLNFVMGKNLNPSAGGGAFGISVGLDHSLVSEASYFEIKKMAELAVKAGALLSYNLKDNKEGIVDSVKKAIFLAKETGVKILINNFKPSMEAFDLIEGNSANADICFCVNLDDDYSGKSAKILQSDKALISSGLPAQADGFGKFLELVEKNKIMTLEEAVKKLTSLPAAKLKLNKRGIIREGYFADLVLFRDAEISDVIINGKRTVREGKFQNILAGKIL
jgi:N-acyl-D-aspartate/D-glutamate deacylase